MKPQTPEEMYEDKLDLADEGMLFIGDKGKILCDFRGNKPRLIPQSRQRAIEGSVVAQNVDTTTSDDEWVNAIKNGTKSKGQLRGGRAARRSGGARDDRAARALQAADLGRGEDGVHELDAGDQVRPPRAVS